MIEMKKIRNLKEIKVIPTDDPLKVYPDDNPNHVALVNGYNIYTRSFHHINISPGYTLEDLKQLRKEIRKVIRNESNKRI